MEEILKELFGEMKMEKPDLNRMWETFIRIGLLNELHIEEFFRSLIEIIRFKISPMISDLEQEKVIGWYHFLIHNKDSGVPTTRDDNNLYFHIRFESRKDIDPNAFLPNSCVMTRKIRRERVESITGIDKSLLKNEEIEEAWRIIGEQSEWVINMLDIHKEDVEIPVRQVGQFLHFFSNMTQLQVK